MTRSPDAWAKNPAWLNQPLNLNFAKSWTLKKLISDGFKRLTTLQPLY
jgi:hypothetical protein